jgi:hypothetical protein
VQPLELALGEGIEVYATNAFLDTRPLQPTEQNLGSPRVGDSAFAQTILDLQIRGRLTLSARCAAPGGTQNWDSDARRDALSEGWRLAIHLPSCAHTRMSKGVALRPPAFVAGDRSDMTSGSS